MPAQPSNHGQNLGLVVLVVGLFMVLIAFLSVTYLNGRGVTEIKQNQVKNSKRGTDERSDLTNITCALWSSVGDPQRVDSDTRAVVRRVCRKHT